MMGVIRDVLVMRESRCLVCLGLNKIIVHDEESLKVLAEVSI
jgi:hypothetical protein